MRLFFWLLKQGASDIIDSLLLRKNGKIVAVGRHKRGNPLRDFFGLAQYNQDGSIDGTFGENGIVVSNFTGCDIFIDAVLQEDGKIVTAEEKTKINLFILECLGKIP